jgi:hypothetical protein
MTKRLAEYQKLIASIEDRCGQITRNWLDYSDDAYTVAQDVIELIKEVETK